MVYCSNCGTQIADDAYFCAKCGTKTAAGKTAKVAYPSDEIRDTFYKVGAELEKAFNIAAKETHDAFKRASDDFNQRNCSAQTNQASQQATVVCPNCGAKNISGAIFCHNCGKRITPETAST
jgi:DNA-directed RNA polymerase subunit RPC12/RpoP